MRRDRLSVVDDIFLRTHRGYGLPIVLQGIWRSDEHVDRVDFAAVHANLASGQLGRRIVTPRVPGARRRWTRSTEAHPLRYDATPLSEDTVLSWADAQGDIELDPEFGPGWRMSVSAVETGGTVMSLVCSHTLADAAGLIAAAGRAFEGSAPEFRLRRTSDIGDAVSLATRVAAGSVRASASLMLSRDSRRELTGYVRSSKTVGLHDVRPSTAIFDIDANLSNTVFISLVAEIAASLGEHEPISINVPFRSNAHGTNRIGMATVGVFSTDTLAGIKSATKAALAKPARAPSGFPAEAVQLMSDAKAASMTSSLGTARVLCSNIGALPTSIASISGHRATTVATRAIHPKAGRSRTKTVLSAYISTMGSTSTLSLVGTENRFVPILTDRASAVLTRRGLPHKSW